MNSYNYHKVYINKGIVVDHELDFLSYYDIPLLIGLTGPTKSGKTIVASRFVSEFGFRYVNLSSFLKELAINLGYEKIHWQMLQHIGQKVRKEYDCDILARWAINYLNSQIISGSKIIIDGILHPAEISYLRSLKHFYLIGIDAPSSVRYTQAKKWYPNQYVSYEDFIERDISENANSDNKNQNIFLPDIRSCLELVDYSISIVGEFTHDTVYLQAEEILNKIIEHHVN